MLELTNVAKSFGGKPVIKSVTLKITTGDVFCLTGPSGIGKSTLLEVMAGVTKPDSGAVTRTGKAALMFQDDVIIPWLTARETVTYILPHTMSEEEKNERATFWLHRFGIEGEQFPAAMSGGMRRRLSLARTFAAERALILLDEPFAFLDEERCRTVAEEIAAHAQAGHAVVLTSHTTEPLSLASFAGITSRTVTVDRSPVVL